MHVYLHACSTQMHDRLKTRTHAHWRALRLIITLIHRSLIIKKAAIKLLGWHILFIPISPMRHCPSPHLPWDTGASSYHLSKTWATPNLAGSGGESGQRESMVWGRGYYLSGHGSLHIFHGCPQGVFSLLLADRIHLKHLWVTCGLRSTLLLFKNKWDKKQMRWDPSDRLS